MKKTCLVCLVTCTFYVTAFSQQLGLDPSFGNKGIAIDKYTGGNFRIANDVAVQPDGKIIASGHFLARYKTNGEPDSSFGSIGILAFDTLIKPHSGLGYGIRILTDGKILVSGTGSGGCFLLRVRSDGKADSSFGTNGVSYFSSGTGNIALQPDGKILVAGQGTGLDDDSACLHRFLPDGKVDAGFGKNGTVSTYTGIYKGAVSGLGILGDGRIAMTGLGYDAARNSAAFLCRFLADGSPDLSLNGSGIIFPIITSYSNRSCILSDGRVLLHVGGVSSGDAVARLKADGSLDSGFGENGFREVPGITISSIVLLADGKILCGGYTPEDWAVARINKDGVSIDMSFGNSGKVVTDIDGFFNDRISGLTVQQDGKIVAIGHARTANSNPISVTLARYYPNGSVGVPAPSSGPNNVLIAPNPGNDRINVRGVSSAEIKRLQIINVEGKCIKTIDDPKTLEMSVKEYPHGAYFIRLTDRQNQHINLRFIIGP